MNPYSNQVPTGEVQPRARLWPLLVVAAGSAIVISLISFFIAGVLMGERWTYQRQSQKRKQEVESLFRKLAFSSADIEVHTLSNGSVYIQGEVKCEASFDLLHKSLVERFGRPCANRMLQVEIEMPEKAVPENESDAASEQSNEGQKT